MRNAERLSYQDQARSFVAGIDFINLMELSKTVVEHEDIARRSNALRKQIKRYQDSITSLEKCPKPVIAAVHSACIGGALNLITAADIRFCSSDAWFQLKEVEIGMAADVGALQRLPKIIGSDSLVRELSYTARKMLAPEAKECGLVSRVYDNKDSLLEGALNVATDIATKSPVAVQLTKRNLVYSRDHTVEDGLEYI
ncbi:unnamed protein product, partial [Timema podura]|nr:unnamed protein product [Timema podura]